jgi:hypothetical protein
MNKPVPPEELSTKLVSTDCGFLKKFRFCLKVKKNSLVSNQPFHAYGSITDL